MKRSISPTHLVSLAIIGTSLSAPGALADVVSLGVTRAGSTYRPSGSPGAAVFASEPYSPLFLVRGGSNIHRGFMVFDLTSVPSGSTITSLGFEFTQESRDGAPTMEIWGDYQTGELAYDTYFSLAGTGGWTQVYADDQPFHSMTNDGSLFGQMTLNAAGDGLLQSVSLTGGGGLGYFQSEIGNQLLLFTRVAHDMDYNDGGHGWDWGGYPTLRVEYSVPTPGAGALGAAGLLVTARRRRR